jgi:lipoprotein-releasing system ATP-binding protein
MLKAEKITRKFGDLHVLKGVDITIETGEMVSIVGSSGAGKSTLLHILGSLDMPDSGSVVLDNQLIQSLSAKKLAAFRNKNIGFIFQFHHLLPEFDALENVSIPGWIAGNNKTFVKERAIELLTNLGLKDRIFHKPQQLSGGEQQRVAVARALINQPKIVFADEPTGNLDSKNAKELHQLFVELNQQTGTSFLIVTHGSIERQNLVYERWTNVRLIKAGFLYTRGFHGISGTSN